MGSPFPGRFGLHLDVEGRVMAWEPPIFESQLQFCPGDQGRWEQPADVRQAALNFSTALQSAPARLGDFGMGQAR